MSETPKHLAISRPEYNRRLAAISVMAAVTFVFSLYMIVTTLINESQEQNAFDELALIVEQEKEQTDAPDDKPEQTAPTPVVEPTTETNTESVILPEYASVYEQNKDCFGWLRIHI